MCLRRGSGVATGRAWAVLLAAADTSREGPKRPSARVLQGFGALAKPGAKRQTQEEVAGWPDFDLFAEKTWRQTFLTTASFSLRISTS